MSYVAVKIDLTKAQQKKLIKGSSVRITKSQIGKGPTIYLHHLNAKKINNSKNGANLSMSSGEILHTAKHNDIISGSGIWDDIWSGIKKIGSFVKDSGIGTILADAAVPFASTVLGPATATAARSILKQTTGVGFSKSDNMTKARAAKRGRISIMPSSGSLTAGSFKIN